MKKEDVFEVFAQWIEDQPYPIPEDVAISDAVETYCAGASAARNFLVRQLRLP